MRVQVFFRLEPGDADEKPRSRTYTGIENRDGVNWDYDNRVLHIMRVANCEDLTRIILIHLDTVERVEIS